MQRETKSKGRFYHCIMYMKRFYDKGIDKLFPTSEKDEVRFMRKVSEESFTREMKKECLTLSF